MKKMSVENLQYEDKHCWEIKNLLERFGEAKTKNILDRFIADCARSYANTNPHGNFKTALKATRIAVNLESFPEKDPQEEMPDFAKEYGLSRYDQVVSDAEDRWEAPIPTFGGGYDRRELTVDPFLARFFYSDNNENPSAFCFVFDANVSEGAYYPLASDTSASSLEEMGLLFTIRALCDEVCQSKPIEADYISQLKSWAEFLNEYASQNVKEFPDYEKYIHKHLDEMRKFEVHEKNIQIAIDNQNHEREHDVLKQFSQPILSATANGNNQDFLFRYLRENAALFHKTYMDVCNNDLFADTAQKENLDAYMSRKYITPHDYFELNSLSNGGFFVGPKILKPYHDFEKVYLEDDQNLSFNDFSVLATYLTLDNLKQKTPALNVLENKVPFCKRALMDYINSRPNSKLFHDIIKNFKPLNNKFDLLIEDVANVKVEKIAAANKIDYCISSIMSDEMGVGFNFSSIYDQFGKAMQQYAENADFDTDTFDINNNIVLHVVKEHEPRLDYYSPKAFFLAPDNENEIITLSKDGVDYPLKAKDAGLILTVCAISKICEQYSDKMQIAEDYVSFQDGTYYAEKVLHKLLDYVNENISDQSVLNATNAFSADVFKIFDEVQATLDNQTNTYSFSPT